LERDDVMSEVCKNCVLVNICEEDCEDGIGDVIDPCTECLVVRVCSEDCEDKKSWWYWYDWNTESLYIAEGTKSAAEFEG
jgi:hypothetical protein